MSEEKSPICLVSEIENNGSLIKEIFYKPQTATIICCIVAVLFIATMKTYAIILGVFILAIAVFVIFKIKDYKTLGIYDTYVIVYSTEDPNYGRRVEMDEITEWCCKNSQGMSDAVMLRLNTGEVIYKDTFQTNKAFKALDKIIPSKETQAIKAAENKKKKLKFSWPFKKKNKGK